MPKFIVPPLGAKIMSLQNPTKKMSKSENNYLALSDKPTDIRKKILKAETDSENKIYYDPKNKPGISNLLVIYTLLKTSPKAEMTLQKAEKEVTTLNYHQFKTKLCELLIDKLQVIQNNLLFYRKKTDELLKKNYLYLQKLAKDKIQKMKKVIHLSQ